MFLIDINFFIIIYDFFACLNWAIGMTIDNYKSNKSKHDFNNNNFQ